MRACWAKVALEATGCTERAAFDVAPQDDLPPSAKAVCSAHLGLVILGLGVPCLVTFVDVA